MLSLDAAVMAQEIQAADDYRKNFTSPLAKIIKRYTGNWYSDAHTCDPTPENHAFAYIAHMLTELAYAAPSPRIKALWQTVHREIAEAMEVGLGRWVETYPLADEIKLWVRDALLGWGVMKCGLEGMGNIDNGLSEHQDRRVSPFAVRISPQDFGMDPRCEKWRDARFLYHSYWKDIDDIKTARGVDLAVADKLVSTYEEKPEKGEGAMAPGETHHRRQVKCIDIWIPEHRKIATMVRSGSDDSTPSLEYLRPPTEWWGPQNGPFEVLGFYSVPNSPYPAGPFQFIMEQLNEVNAHAAAASREAAGMKNIVAVDAASPDVADNIKTAPTNGVILVKGLAEGGKVVPITIGGASPQRMEHIETLRERVDRFLAFSDQQRGLGGSPKTATESQITQNNTDTRTEHMRNCVNGAMESVFKKVGWYAFYDENYVQKVGYRDPQTGENADAYFVGGSMWPGHGDVAWPEDFKISIDPNSMQRQDDAVISARWIQLSELMMKIAPLLIQYPFVQWKQIIDGIGESFNQPDLWSLLIDEGLLQQFGAVVAQAQMANNGVAWPGINPGLSERLGLGGGMGMPGMPQPMLPGPGMQSMGQPMPMAGMMGPVPEGMSGGQMMGQQLGMARMQMAV